MNDEIFYSTGIKPIAIEQNSSSVNFQNIDCDFLQSIRYFRVKDCKLREIVGLLEGN